MEEDAWKTIRPMDDEATIARRLQRAREVLREDEERLRRFLEMRRLRRLAEEATKTK